MCQPKLPKNINVFNHDSTELDAAIITPSVAESRKIAGFLITNYWTVAPDCSKLRA
jgi:hypothetical protein